jgi:hypothetical protein
MRVRTTLILATVAIVLGLVLSMGGTETHVEAQPAGNLTITKNDSLDPITVGQTENFFIVVGNISNVVHIDTVTVTDNVPATFAVTGVSGVGWTCNRIGNSVTCTRSDDLLGPASYPPIQIQATAVTPSAGSTNTASATALFSNSVTENRNAQSTTVIAAQVTTTATTTATTTTTATVTQTATVTATATQTATATATQIFVPPTVIREPIFPQPTVTATATQTAIPPQTTTATATQTATVTQTATTTATATQTATVTATQTATVTRTATATQTATQTSTQVPGIPQDVQLRSSVQLVSAEYVSGPRQLTVGQRTGIRATYRVTNNSSERLDYNATVVFNTGSESTATSAMVTAGTAAIMGSQVRWGGFALSPGESASITMNLDVVPAMVSVGRASVIITSTNTTARSASGGFVNVTGPELTTASVSGLAGGGIVAGAVTPAAGGGAIPGAGPTGPAAPVPAPAAPGAQVLPRVGAGGADGAGGRAVITVLLAAATFAAFPAGIWYRRRRSA